MYFKNSDLILYFYTPSPPLLSENLFQWRQEQDTRYSVASMFLPVVCTWHLVCFGKCVCFNEILKHVSRS